MRDAAPSSSSPPARELPEGDDDERLLPPGACRARRRGALGRVGRPVADWLGVRLVVVRSTWDYTGRLDAFLRPGREGCRGCATRSPVLRWNTDKRYLDDLADAGSPVVPTAFVTPGGPRPPLHGEVVVKPACLGGRARHRALRARSPPRAHAHLSALQPRGVRRCSSPTWLCRRARRDGAALRRGRVLARDPQGPDPAPRAAARRGCASIEARPVRRRGDQRARAHRDRARGGRRGDRHLEQRFGAALLYARVDLVEDGPASRACSSSSSPSLRCSSAPRAGRPSASPRRSRRSSSALQPSGHRRRPAASAM